MFATNLYTLEHELNVTMSTLTFLSNITLVLFIGLIMGLIAKKLKIPSMLLLIFAGAVLSNITVGDQNLINFGDEFLISASIMALVLIVFKGSSNLSIRDVNTYTQHALKIAILFLVFNMLFLSIGIFYIFQIKSMILSLVFAAVMSGTDPGSVLALFPTKSNKITEILKFESLVNTPIVVLIPFILLDLIQLDSNSFGNFIEYFNPFMQQIITGIGAGVFFGIIVFKFMRNFYSHKLSPLTLIISSLITYILAEQLGGNGVLAVTVFGIFFGNTQVRKKVQLKGFSTMLSNILEILVFTLIGFLLPFDLQWDFVAKSLILFVIMILIRFMTIELVFLHEGLKIKERIFMSVNCAKGIAVAVIAFILSNYTLNIPMIVDGVKINNTMQLINYSGVSTIIDLMILFMVYSIILSTIMSRFSNYFIKIKVEEDSE